MEVRRLLKRVRRVQQLAFSKVVADQLQAYRHAALAKARGNAHPRQAGQACGQRENVGQVRSHRVVVWAKHGVMARSDMSVKNAADRVEYAETAAKYEYLFWLMMWIGLGFAALAFIAAPLIRRGMHGVK